MISDEGKPSPFPETRWTLIERVAGADPDQREKALSDVCKAYWPPIYAFVRALRHSPHDAEDLTQGFFARFLSKDAFATITPEKGRLRSYLLASVKYYLADEHRRTISLKRGGGEPILAMTPAEIERLSPVIENVAQLGPDLVYERLWAMRMLETVYQRVEDRYREKGQSTSFEALSPFIRADMPAPDKIRISTYLELTPNALRAAIFRLRQRYRETLRKVVAETLEPGGDVDEEIQYLMSLFS